MLLSANLPTLTVGDTTTSGTSFEEFPITLSAPAIGDVIASYTVMPSVGNVYTTPGQFRIPEGQTAAVIYVLINAYVDTISCSIHLSILTNNAMLSNGQSSIDAIGTITPGPYIGEDSQLSVSSTPSDGLGTPAPITVTAVINQYAMVDSDPTGIVKFEVDDAYVGEAALVPGSLQSRASFETNVPFGDHEIKAIYMGDAFYRVAVSSEPVTVKQTSLTSVQISQISPSPNLSYMVATSVTPQDQDDSSPVPTGEVTITEYSEYNSDGSGYTLILEGGAIATYGPYTLDATGHVSESIQGALGTNFQIAYLGDAHYAASETSMITPVPTGLTPTVTLNASTTVAPQGDAITLSASVLGFAPSPTGTVNFLSDNVSLGSATIGNDDYATIETETTALPLGIDNIFATYSGDTSYVAVSSGAIQVDVIAPSVTSIAGSATALARGDSDSFTVTVASTNSAQPTPTGTIMIEEVDTPTTLGQDSSSSEHGPYSVDMSGQALITFQTTATNAEFTASYSGDTNYSSSSSVGILLFEPSYVGAPSPSLGAYQWYLPKAGIAGQRFNAFTPVEIANDSHQQIKGEFIFDVFASESATSLDGNQVMITSTEHSKTITADGRLNFSLSIHDLPPSLTTGTYFLMGDIIAPDNTYLLIPSGHSFTVTEPAVRLSSAVIKISPSIATGKSGFLILTIKNSGNIAATGALQITVTAALASAANLTIGSLSSRHVSINPGVTRRYRVRIKVPAATLPGTANLYVQVTLAGVAANAIGPQPLTIK